jgi:hypothetical protein
MSEFNKFKVGNRVKVVSYPEDEFVGFTGTVIDITLYYVVRFDDRHDGGMLFEADELELLVEPKLEPESDVKKKIFTQREHLESLIKATANTYMQSTDPAHFVVAGMFEACLTRFDFLYSEIDRLNKKLKEREV